MKKIYVKIFKCVAFIIFFLALYIPVQVVIGLAWGTFYYFIGKDIDDLMSMGNVIIILLFTIPISAILSFIFSNRFVNWMVRSIS